MNPKMWLVAPLRGFNLMQADLIPEFPKGEEGKGKRSICFVKGKVGKKNSS